MSEVKEKVKPKRIVKKVDLNCVQRQLVFRAMFTVYQEGANVVASIRSNKVDRALDFDGLAAWEKNKTEAYAERIRKWDADGRKDVVPTMTPEEELGPNETYIIPVPTFEFIQDFLTKNEKYPLELRKYVGAVIEKFAIEYDEIDEDCDEEYEDVVEEVTCKDIKKIEK